MNNNNLNNLILFINRILLGIAFLLGCSVSVNSQVKIAFSHGSNNAYLEALISKALIKEKGENWYMNNVINPIIRGDIIHYRHLMVVYIDGKVKFYKVKNTPDYIIDALNDAASHLEKSNSIILCPIGYFEQLSLDSISKNVEYFRSLILKSHLKNLLRLCYSTIDTTEIGHKERMYYKLITTNTPIIAKIFNAWGKTSLINEYLSNPELEMSGISIIEYLKQEVDKILSRPLPKSTLDYGITNEDFWPIGENTNENKTEDANSE